MLATAFFLFVSTQVNAQDDWDHIDHDKIIAADTITKGPYSLVFINMSPGFDTSVGHRLIDAYFNVYPEEQKLYNRKAVKAIVFVIDPQYDGVAATSGHTVRINPEWLKKHPDDIDLITHELMHLVQAYPGDSGPGWVTEGIADYVRYTLGIDNAKANWSLPDLSPKHNYDNAYRITARFFYWIETTQKKGFVKKLDAVMRSANYSDDFWKKQTGKTLDELWAAYKLNPTITPLANTAKK